MIRRWLTRVHSTVFILYAVTAAFGTYFCMYAFRRPFTVATFEGLELWGVDYKILLIISQVLGYMLSKFIGIKVISELGRKRRAAGILLLIGLSELALFFFGLVPYPYNFIFLFLNGIPLGMIWGIVFSYLEGRTSSEVLGAGLSASFIVSSGAVKSAGKVVLDSWQVPPFWMPFITGALFTLPLLFFTWMLEQLPPPTAEDEALRTPRRPMDAADRKALLRRFAPGLVLLIGFYMLLTAYRDFRDNFAAELWSALGFGDTPSIFAVAELPIAFAVLVVLGMTMFIRNNGRAFFLYHLIIMLSLLLIGLSTWLFQQQLIHPAVWMILVGLGLYVSYVPFNCIFFDRMIATFRFSGNAGFLIYVADSFGYLGSVGVLLFRNFGEPDLSWLRFFVYGSYGLALAGAVAMIGSAIYFASRYKQMAATTPLPM